MIYRIKISKLLPDLSEVQVLSFRVSDNDQANAEAYGERLRTRWMELNPGIATIMALDWPRPEELGQHHVMPYTGQ